MTKIDTFVNIAESLGNMSVENDVAVLTITN